MTTSSITVKPAATTISTREILRDMGAWLAHAVVAGVLIGLACTAVVALIATAGA